MKNVTIIVGVLAGASLLTGCNSATNTVRNGYLQYNRTITIGQALEHTFSNGKWKSFTTEKGATIVEFDGSEPFSKFRGAVECSANPICAALYKKISDNCSSAAGQAPYVKAYQEQRDNIKNRIAILSKQEDDLTRQGAGNSGPGGTPSVQYGEVFREDADLTGQLNQIESPENSCVSKAWDQNANDPIPIIVQFSVNKDGTFQYEGSDTFLNPDTLFYRMYN
jgi:hypothetical protein